LKTCDFCFEEECKKTNTPFSCNCETCERFDTCYRILQPTVRMTLKCTQECSHCCYECSPQKESHMSILMSEKISEFLKKYEISTVNLMGGEFSCNPNWLEIIRNITMNTNVRLVTNGDFGEDIIDKLQEFKTNLRIAVSKDRWHSNKNVKRAEKLLKKYKFNYRITTEEEGSSNSIVPIGRSFFFLEGPYSQFSCYCRNPIRKYSFLIDEKGIIFKCPFGLWEIDDIENDIKENSFLESFKDFNKKFHSCFIPNCYRCVMITKFRGKKDV